jgi:hypothetical protein
MRTFTAFALSTALALLTVPAAAQVVEEELTSAPIIGVSLTDRIWVRTDRPDMPGSMHVFLSDGTLLTDSCWETYRISSWFMTSDTEISWEEDGMAIEAEIITLDEAELVLQLQLIDEVQEQRYELAPVPYVCPDMVR